MGPLKMLLRLEWLFPSLTRLRTRGAFGLSPIAIGLALATLSSAAQAPLDVRVALVIGNAAYKHVPALSNSVNDAKSMSLVLNRLGFKVVDVIDGDRASMVRAIDQLQGQLKGKQAVAMLYYAGHGLQLDWRNYMVPVDANLQTSADVPRQTIDIEEVIKAFKASGTRMNILVLDACRDNPFSDKGTGKGLAQLDAPPGTYLAFATAPGNVAEDGDEISGNGLYTHFLLQELQKPAKVEDLFKRVRLQVRKKTQGRQIPWDSTSLEEDFAFNDGVKFTYRPEDLALEAAKAKEREEALKREALLAQDREKALALAAALETARLEEAQRLKDLDFARQQAEEARLMKASEEARQAQFIKQKTEWDKIKESRNVNDFYAFLQRYPGGFITEQAAFAIEQLEKAKITPQADKDGTQGTSNQARFRVGDKYSYVSIDNLTGREVRRFSRLVTKIEGGIVHIAIEGGEEKRTLDAGKISVVSSATTYHYDPPKAELPGDGYVVGKKWTGAYVETDLKTGRKYIRQDQFKILQKERISIKGEVFDTFKIENSSVNQYGITGTLTYWIEPGKGLPIKTLREVFSNRGQKVISETIDLIARVHGPD